MESSSYIMSSPHLSEGSKMNYIKLRNSLFFHEGAVLPLFVTTIINRKSMGKWMSFFLFILCSGKSGVLGFWVIFENVGRILSDSPASTFETGRFCHWSLYFLSFLLWFSFWNGTSLVFSVDIVSGTVWTQRERQLFFNACWYLGFDIHK